MQFRIFLYCISISIFISCSSVEKDIHVPQFHLAIWRLWYVKVSCNFFFKLHLTNINFILFELVICKASISSCLASALVKYTFSLHSCAVPEGRGQGIWTHLKNHKKLDILAILVQIHWKVIKLAMLGHHPQASETPFKWRFAGGSMIAHLYWHLDPPS